MMLPSTGGSTTLSVTGNALGGGAVIIQVCASGGLKRESNSLAPGAKLRRNQAALASHALAPTGRHPEARESRTRTSDFAQARQSTISGLENGQLAAHI